ncbi:MAG: type II secretion system F family protein [Candidatus Doudnabacteria bacterium]|nr:type II secretion system F family protein [Candidatus Doudnabacteria bacterium]
MPEYSYIARNKAGMVEENIIEAFNERAVVDRLRSQGMLPTSIKLVKKSINFSAVNEWFARIKLLDKITFIKNLGVMIRAGLPVSRSLKILTAQTPNPKFAKIIAEVARGVESGTSLADSLARFPKVFSPIFVSMVHVGEVSGNLEKNLFYLADQLQRDYDLIAKAKGALTYPLVVLGALVIVGFLMFTFVLPKLTQTFVDLGVELPFMTRIVIGVVDVFAHYGLLILALLVGLIIAFVFWRKTESGKTVLHKLVFYVPVVSGLVIKINQARFVRVLASLVKSGMPIVEALSVSAHVVNNVYYQRTISDASSKVKIGSPLSSAFKKQPKLFSNLVIQMMEVGEESGTTEAVLTEVADFYETEIDQTMKNMSSILEPVLMVIIGSVVGFLAIALITPIYNITQTIG